MVAPLERYILEAVETRLKKKGDSFRMRHEFRMDGSVCTGRSDDPAMKVTKLGNGWVWICHRCKASGFVADATKSPSRTSADLRSKLEAHVLSNKMATQISMPHDVIPMTNEKSPSVPYEAYNWMWKCMVTGNDMLKYGICWSPSYERVIIPIYEYKDNVKLIGWIGRDVGYNLAEGEKRPKYLTRKLDTGRRIYFVCKGLDEEDNRVIIVEDCLSAMRVNDATGIKTIALLTTSVDDDLMRTLRGRDVYMWLDADAVGKSIKITERMRQLGITAKHIYTSKDPKCYNMTFIMVTFRNCDMTHGREVPV